MNTKINRFILFSSFLIYLSAQATPTAPPSQVHRENLGGPSNLYDFDKQLPAFGPAPLYRYDLRGVPSAAPFQALPNNMEWMHDASSTSLHDSIDPKQSY